MQVEVLIYKQVATTLQISPSQKWIETLADLSKEVKWIDNFGVIRSPILVRSRHLTRFDLFSRSDFDWGSVFGINMPPHTSLKGTL
jgi:hypothetical protein